MAGDVAGGFSDLEMTWLLYCAGAATAGQTDGQKGQARNAVRRITCSRMVKCASSGHTCGLVAYSGVTRGRGAAGGPRLLTSYG